jgi:nucleoside-triphosphatase
MKPCRLFLTGEPGCGKTTAITKAVGLLGSEGVKVAGIVTTEMRENGMRVGFSIEDLVTKNTGTLAHVHQKEGPRVGKYRVNLSDIQRVAVAGIQRAVSESDVIVVDELGPMELKSEPFIQEVQTALAAPKHFIGTIHKRASHPFIIGLKSNPNYQILGVTIENRNEIPRIVVEKVQSAM